jgi:parallel beta-helix repeat protein
MKTNISAVVFLLLFAGMLPLVGALPTKTNETIYIRLNGNVEGTTSILRDGDLYIFIDNINDPIVIDRDNMTLDGAGYILQGFGSGIGIDLSYRSNVTIKNLEIRGFDIGISFLSSSNNTIIQNNIANNNYGIVQRGSSNNTIVGNNLIANNKYGIWFSAASNNTYYYNNFINNTQHAYMDIYCCNTTNFWDNGVEGNYWSNYTGVDSNHDGIGDAPHEIVVLNVDYYPLMGMFHKFTSSSGYDVNIISNSTVEDFQYSVSNGTIVIHVSNMTTNQTGGFCRLAIPHALSSPPYNITINNTPVTYVTAFENSTLSIIYFSYEHSLLEIVIIPEFPTFSVLVLSMIATLLAVVLLRKKRLSS